MDIQLFKLFNIFGIVFYLISCNSVEYENKISTDTSTNNSINTLNDNLSNHDSLISNVHESYIDESFASHNDTSVTVNAEGNKETEVLMMRSKCKITFHSKNLVYENDNKPVHEKVKIEYTDLRSFSRISHHRLSMQYDSTKEQIYSLQSAAMFYIKMKGSQSNKNIKTTNNQLVEVEMPVDEDLKNYSLYKYDLKSNSWVKIKRKLKEVEEGISDNGIEAPSKPTKNDFIFDLDINTETFPELKKYKNIVWQYAAQGRYPDPAKEKWVFDEEWQDARLSEYDSKKHLYLLTLKSKKKSFQTVVRRALVGQDYIDEEKRYASRSKSMATKRKVIVSVSESGIYNIDRINEFSQPYSLETDFMYQNKAIDKDAIVYDFYDKSKRVVQYTYSGYYNFHKLTFDLKYKDHCILVILPDGKLLGYSSTKINQMLVRKPKAFRFELKELKGSAYELNDISKAAESLL